MAKLTTYDMSDHPLSSTIIHTEDAEGRGLVRVPLSRGRHGWATLYETDLHFLEEMGLSLRWCLLNNGYVAASAWQAPGKLILVGRVLLDAQRGQSVRYLNGDATDLRSDNLELITEGWGTRRDRDYITPWNEKKRRKEWQHEYI